jgi:hypothetical protein
MAYCIDCKKELSQKEIDECGNANTYGLYCTVHLAALLRKTPNLDQQIRSEICVTVSKR